MSGNVVTPGKKRGLTLYHLKLLALDFDGVICHSSREIFQVTLRTCAAMDPGSDAIGHLARLRARRESKDDFSADPVYKAFVALLPLGNRAEDFAVAFSAVTAGLAFSDQDAYDQYFAAQDAGWKEAFHQAFYEQRAALRTEDRAGWLALHGTWPEFVDLLKNRAGTASYAICTAKDTVSVRTLLDHFGIGDLFSDEMILDKEAGAEKTAHLSELSRRTGIDFSRITFVDDKVSHLQKLSALGVRCVLAGWGDNGAREHARARQEGFAVASLADAPLHLFPKVG